QAGGGPMMDFGCHRIEVLMNLLGSFKRTISDVACVKFDREVEDTTVALFAFENKARGILPVTRAAFESQDQLVIVRSEGSCYIPVLNRGEIHIKTKDGERTESHPPHANIHQPLMEDFTRSLLDGREPKVGGRIGREVAGIEEEIYAAIV